MVSVTSITRSQKKNHHFLLHLLFLRTKTDPMSKCCTDKSLTGTPLNQNVCVKKDSKKHNKL